MRLAGYVLSVLLALTGVVWILQGINILPGSFMTGHIEWAVAGAACLVIGAALAAFTHRRSG